MNKPEHVSIIGFGRFGQLLATILQADFRLSVHDPHIDAKAKSALKLSLCDLQEALSADAIFYCVPISSFEEIFSQHAKLIGKDSVEHTIIDVLSVKMHAQDVFEKYLPENCQALLTHPMFGPDSVKAQGLAGQPIVIDKFTMPARKYSFWHQYFEKKELQVIEMSAAEHDQLAAESQGLTHFIGRVLSEFGFQPTAIDTVGAKTLHEIENQVCNDSWQLFEDLQNYNPYTRAMRVRLADAQAKVFDKLLPNRINKEKLIVGIQGGKGSFNEEAARYYLSRTPDLPYELRYLYTTDHVLRSLYEGSIDRGQFAIHNSTGGVVGESIAAMANYRFNIVEEFAIKISHALMIAPAADFSKVDTVMSHPQALKQCRTNLEKKYERLKQASGEGELVDHSKVAQLLGKGELPPNIATLGSKVLASIWGLKIVEEDLQDLQENFTSFLWVERPHSTNAESS